jgi:hypothetical protein
MRLNRFEILRPGLWSTFVPEAAEYGFRFEQLYVNGERRYREQTSNRGAFYQVGRVG